MCTQKFSPPASEKQSHLNTTRAYGMGGGLFPAYIHPILFPFPPVESTSPIKNLQDHCYGQDSINEGVGYCGVEVTTIMI